MLRITRWQLHHIPFGEPPFVYEKMDEAKRVYYQMFGWTESGTPTYARLTELCIEWAGQYLDESA